MVRIKPDVKMTRAGRKRFKEEMEVRERKVEKDRKKAQSAAKRKATIALNKLKAKK